VKYKYKDINWILKQWHITYTKFDILLVNKD